MTGRTLAVQWGKIFKIFLIWKLGSQEDFRVVQELRVVAVAKDSARHRREERLFTAVICDELAPDHGQALPQLGRFEHFRLVAPAQDPALDFLETAELQLQFQPAIAQFPDLL